MRYGNTEPYIKLSYVTLKLPDACRQCLKELSPKSVVIRINYVDNWLPQFAQASFHDAACMSTFISLLMRRKHQNPPSPMASQFTSKGGINLGLSKAAQVFMLRGGWESLRFGPYQKHRKEKPRDNEETVRRRHRSHRAEYEDSDGSY